MEGLLAMELAVLTSTQRRALAARARAACITYADHPLPPGSDPPRGRVGVEGRADGVVLYVERGVAYHGGDSDVAQWLSDGEKDFPTVPVLIEWLAAKTHPGLSSSAGGAPKGAETVTDLDAIPDLDPSIELDADVLLTRLSSRVVGQAPALQTVATAVARHLGKRQARRPATLLLVGPTGSGKTMTAVTLVESLRALTGRAWPLVRLDMTEFSEAHSVSRLHGAPPGYIGYDDGQNLATTLRSDPQAVVLFDEIEKAHPAVHRAVMNLLDAGRLSGAGAPVDATGCIMLFTSNLATEEFAALAGDLASMDSRGRALLIARGMPSEIVGRITALCAYSQPSSREQAAIAAHAVMHVADDYAVSVTWIDPHYLTSLLRRLRDNRIGARGLEYLAEVDLGQQLAAAAAGSSVRVDLTDAGPAITVGPIDPERPPRPNKEVNQMARKSSCCGADVETWNDGTTRCSECSARA